MSLAYRGRPEGVEAVWTLVRLDGHVDVHMPTQRTVGGEQGITHIALSLVLLDSHVSSQVLSHNDLGHKCLITPGALVGTLTCTEKNFNLCVV